MKLIKVLKVYKEIISLTSSYEVNEIKGKRNLRKKPYNTIKVLKNLLFLVSRISKGEELNIVFDMDNTVFQYSKYGRDDISLTLEDNQGFYENLETYPEATEAFNSLLELKNVNTIFLSATKDNEYCGKEKILSIKTKFPMFREDRIILSKHGENKAQKLIEQGYNPKNSILVDDYYINLMDWTNAGGVPVKKTYSCKNRNIPQVHKLTEVNEIVNKILTVVSNI